MADPLRIEIPTTETEALEPPETMRGPLASDPKLVIQACLLAIAVLVVCYVAASIILPIILAIILKLLFQPGMRLLERLRVPRSLAALLLIFAVFGFIVGVGAALSGPATAWAEKLPGGVQRLEERLRFLSQPIGALQKFLHQFDGVAGASGGASGPTLAETLMKGTQHFASGFFETILILFFLLVSGDTFLRRMVEIVPSFSDKRRVVELSQQVEENVSAYLVTITLMNLAVGVATGLVMWACGLGDPVLWGTVAFLLNYVPIMGPLAGVVLFLLAGLLTIDPLWQALLPAGLYLLIHILEGEAITPMLLARRFTLNPVLVIISLIFWFWMWGVPGAILAVPMLAIAKIICDGVRPLNPLGHFLEG
ncbi:AI-2E family transporter [Kaistia adipata]|uniref:AI-2E family transporter n=1 Tax=Kaistia adipata TaxID=166954 RepID=UPI000408C1CD|nr:AI-2E family transporter [Kaistia adipata]